METCLLGSDQVSQKTGCTATEDGKRLEIWDLGGSEIEVSTSIYVPDLHLCFHICKKQVLS